MIPHNRDTPMLLRDLIETSVHCLTTGEKWTDSRSVEELIEIGAVELCNGGGIRVGSRITDAQRQVVSTVVVSVLVIGSAVRAARR